MNMTPTERAALERLLDLASGNTHQAGHAAGFVLAWWNAGDLGGFDLARLARVDRTVSDDMLTVMAFIARAPELVYPDDYRAEIEAVIRQWRPEVWARSVSVA